MKQRNEGSAHHHGNEDHKKLRLWDIAKTTNLQKQIDGYESRKKKLEEQVNKLREEDQTIIEQINNIKAILEDKCRKSKGIKNPNTSQVSQITMTKNNMQSETAEKAKKENSVLSTQNIQHENYQSELNLTMINEKAKNDLRKLENNKDLRTVEISSLISQNKQMKAKIEDLRREIILQNNIVRNMEAEIEKQNHKIVESEDRYHQKHYEEKTLRENAYIMSEATRLNDRNLKTKIKNIKDDIHLENLKHKQGKLRRDQQDGSTDFAGDTQTSGFSTYPKSHPLLTGVNITTGSKRNRAADTNREDLERKQLQKKTEYENNKNAIFVAQNRIHELKEKISKFEHVMTEFYAEVDLQEERDLDMAIKKFDQENEEYQKNENDARIFAENLESLKQFEDMLKKEIENVRANKIKKYTKRDRLVEKRAKEIDEIQKNLDLFEKKQAEMKRTILSIKIAIPEIFRKIGCEPLKDTTYDKDEITDNNILTYLFAIERRADEILTLYDTNIANLNLANNSKKGNPWNDEVPLHNMIGENIMEAVKKGNTGQISQMVRPPTKEELKQNAALDLDKQYKSKGQKFAN